jgi:hypothetical protein
MRTLIEALAGLAILANAVVYGTDVFGAIVLRPAIAAVDDRTLTQLLGHIHRIADRRFPAIGAGGLIAAVAMTAVAAASEHWVSAAAGGTRRARPDQLHRDLQPGQQAREHHADRGGTRRPGARRRSSTPSPLGLRHRRARGAAGLRPRRAVRRARRSLTVAGPPHQGQTT